MDLLSGNELVQRDVDVYYTIMPIRQRNLKGSNFHSIDFEFFMTLFNRYRFIIYIYFKNINAR